MSDRETMAEVNGTQRNHSRGKSADIQEETFDNVLETLGSLGWFQTTQITLIWFSAFFGAFMALGFVFLGYTPPYKCNQVNETELLAGHGLSLQNSSIEIVYKSCDIEVIGNTTGHIETLETIPCPRGRNFTQHSTYSSYWDLVCESKGLAELSYTLYSAGRIAGGFLGSVFPDKYGRKATLLLFATASCALEIVSIFSPNIYVLSAFRFGSGFFHQTMTVVTYIYSSELVVSRHRQELSVWITVLWIIAALIIGALAYLLQDFSWKYLQMFISIHFLVIFAQLLFLKESLRWLTAKNRMNDAIDVLLFACHKNGVDFNKVNEKFMAYVNRNILTNAAKDEENQFASNIKTTNYNAIQQTNYSINEKKRSSVFSLLMHKKVVILALINAYIWVTCAFVYFGLFLTSTTLLGNRFLNFSLMTLVELPSTMFLPTMGSKVGRKTLLIIVLMMTSVGMLGSTLFTILGKESHTMQRMSVAFSILGKFAISAAFSLVYIVTAEIFPTVIRSSVTGFCSCVSRLGMVIAPFLRPLAEINIWAPALVFTSVVAFAVVFSLWLPETKNKDMPNTMEEFLAGENRQKSKEIDADREYILE